MWYAAGLPATVGVTVESDTLAMGFGLSANPPLPTPPKVRNIPDVILQDRRSMSKLSVRHAHDNLSADRFFDVLTSLSIL